MRLPVTANALLVSIYLALPISAHLAHVYLADPPRTSGPSTDTLSPSAARLVLAQRLGVAEYHSLKNADDETLKALNTYGGQQRRLFGEIDDAGRRRQVILVVEGVEHSSWPAHSSSFQIQDPPAASENAKLFDDIAYQYEHSHRNREDRLACREFDESKFDEQAGFVTKSRLNAGCLTIIRGETTNDDQVDAKSLSFYIIQNFLGIASDVNADLTAIFIEPRSNPSNGMFKRSPSAPSTSWGSYILPKRQAPSLSGLVDDIKDAISSNAETDDTPSRPTIEDDADATPSPAQDDDSPSSSSSATATASATPTNTSAPRGILPACYTSLSDCNAQTHHCSGNGNCTLKYDLTSSRNEKRQDRSHVSTKEKCYSCSCTPSVRDVPGGGKKTTRWAGPACQKKDVSEAFWLLAGFTVVLVGIVSWGIGLLYSMGAEELPSVIGAGVAGPRAK